MRNLRRPRNRILTREQADEILKPYYDDLLRCVQSGLDQFLQLPDSLRAVSRPRTLANLLNDTIRSDAVRRFQDDVQVSMNLEHEGALFIFAEKIALRFKKVDADLMPRNVRTARQHDIAEQQLELSGVTIPTVVNLGYQPNVIFTEIRSVSLICRRHRNLLWQIPLADELQGYLFNNEGEAQPVGTPVVRPKLTRKVAANV